ncbi:MAG TPA: SRPBCC family protein [Acidimicrobiales bacterium]
MEKQYELYIKTTPDLLWLAIVDPDIRAKYNFGARMSSDWTPGASIEVRSPDGAVVLGTGEVLEADPPTRLVHTLVAHWSAEVEAEGASRATWDVEPVGDSCRLLLTHDQLRDGANAELYGGWPMILSGLKTWLETGELLTTPGSMMYT